MTINIIEDGPTISITRSDMERLMLEYWDSQRMTTRPVSFETWLRQRQKQSPIHRKLAPFDAGH